MDIAILSDIHGNEIALRRCVEYALEKNVRTFFFLGDYTGELAYPQRTLRFLYDLKNQYDCFFVRGNKEEYWLNYRDSGEKGWKEYDSTTGSLWYTYHELTKEDLDFFAALPIARKVTLNGLPPVMICHGSPDRANEKMLPDSKRTFELMDEADVSMILCGHTHIQGKIMHGGKAVLNPGAVGVSLHGGGKAQFLILHGTEEGWKEEFVSLDYDAERVIGQLHESGLDKKAPCWCKVTEHLLRSGEVPHGTVLNRAMALCREENGKCDWPRVPEQFWEQAVREMLG